MNPANSGGTAADEATGGASGSGASRTMLTTAPPTPTQVTGTHRASAAAHASGSTTATVAAPRRANGTSGDGRRGEVVGEHPARVDAARRRCGRGGRSPATAARRRRDRAGTGRRRRRRAPASCRASTATAATPAAIASTRHPHEPGDRVAQQAAPAAAPHGRGRPMHAVAPPSARRHGRLRGRSPRSWRRSSTTVRRSCIVTAKCSWDTRSARRTSGSTRSRPATSDGDDGQRRRRRRRRRGRPAPGASPTGRGCRSSRPARGTTPATARGLGGEHDERRAPWPASAAGAATWASTATATNAAPVAAPATAPLAAHATAEPGSRRAASWPAMPPTSGAAEGHRAQPLDDRAGEHVAARDGRQQEVADVRRLDRDRPAVAAAAQAEGDGDGDGQRRGRPGRGRGRRRPRPASPASSETSPLSQSTTPPPTRAARYTR